MKFQELRTKADRQIEVFRQDISSIRTGRATSALVENLKIDAYEGSSPLSLKEVAAISTPDPTTIVIRPWDLSLMPKIEKGLRSSSAGFNPTVFDDLLRINLPPLSQERRLEFIKVVKSKAEVAKVELRQIRQDEMRSIDEMEENGVISEDARFKTRSEVEELIKEKSEEIEKITREKEAELLKM